MTGVEEAEEEEEGLFSSMEEGLFSSISLLGKLTVSNELGISEDVSNSGSPFPAGVWSREALPEGRTVDADVLRGPLSTQEFGPRDIVTCRSQPGSAQGGVPG